jgi:hypothetical protein
MRVVLAMRTWFAIKSSLSRGAFATRRVTMHTHRAARAILPLAWVAQ